MMKKLLTIALVLIGFCVQAQERKTVFEKFSNNKAFSIGAQGYLPSGNPFNAGYGASIKYELPIAQDLSLTSTLAYARMSYKDVYKEEIQPTNAASFIPLTVGARYFLGDKFYFEGDIGGGYVSNFRKSSILAVQLHAGYTFKVSKTSSFDASIGYLNWGNSDHLKFTTLKLAYRVEWL
nr:outer membrane beta-barrel protein [uncultured Mucilaginibacter sp.]